MRERTCCRRSSVTSDHTESPSRHSSFRVAGVEVGLALDYGVGWREATPVGEAAVAKDSSEFVEGSVAGAEGVGGFRDQGVVPVCVAQLLLGAGVDHEDTAGFQHPGELRKDPAMGGEALWSVVLEVMEDLVDHNPVEVFVLEGQLIYA